MGISDKKRPKMGLFCSYMTKVCIVSVANLSQLCTLLLHYLSCILAAYLTPPAEAHHA